MKRHKLKLIFCSSATTPGSIGNFAEKCSSTSQCADPGSFCDLAKSFPQCHQPTPDCSLCRNPKNFVSAQSAGGTELDKHLNYRYILKCASFLYILVDGNIPPALSDPAGGSGEDGISSGAIAGIAAAVMLSLVAALAAALWFFKSKRYRKIDVKNLV